MIPIRESGNDRTEERGRRARPGDRGGVAGPEVHVIQRKRTNLGYDPGAYTRS